MNEKNLLAATLLNLVITVVEVAGGILSGSLALLSDALHNLSDTFATFIAYLATVIGKRDANPEKDLRIQAAGDPCSPAQCGDPDCHECLSAQGGL